ncbi:MAG TPA: alpha/beta fold hydrolase [Acetobacteraceae bacterium]|nr:alpha/beta fold hydrolase [Acetobacteraceae bacterium]
MSDTATLVSRLRDQDIRLWIEGDRLRCGAPADKLDAELRGTLVSRKAEIMAFLQEAKALASPSSTMVPIKRDGSKPPIFAVSGHAGDVFCLRALAHRLDPDQPVIGVRPPGLDGSEPLTSVEDLARFQVEQIRDYRPKGPYLIAGHCAGGTIAFEVAQQLRAAGHEVGLLALIGSPYPTSFRFAPQLMLRLKNWAGTVLSGSLRERQQRIMRKVRERLQSPAEEIGITPAITEARRRVEGATVAAVRRYRPQHYAGQIDLFIAADFWHKPQRWRAVAETVREHYLGDFETNDLLIGSHVPVLAQALNARLQSI